MAYNRCIGTRYCANNCPYKVRRFNFLDYTRAATSRRAATEDAVSTRTSPCACRGVMEKCTYCVQRIQEAKIDAHSATAATACTTATIVTACQQACPTEAITLRRPQRPDERRSRSAARATAQLRAARGAQHRARARRTSRRIRNPNPEMESVAHERRRRHRRAASTTTRRAATPLVRGDARPSTASPRRSAGVAEKQGAARLVDRCSASRRASCWHPRRLASATCSGRGVGVWGNNNPVGWAWDITNFVFWIGIGHAGTLISAILFLFRQKWRTGDQPRRRGDDDLRRHRARCIFPGIHVGRVWFAYWMFPLPNQMSIWPNFTSPLLVGRLRGQHLLHGLAALLVRRPRPRPRDAARPRHRAAVRQIALRHPRARLARLEPPLAALRARVPDPRRPLDAARALGALRRLLRLRRRRCMPGWHTTIFPPYFVAGAIFSGFAMVLTLMLIAARGLRPRAHRHACSTSRT